MDSQSTVEFVLIGEVRGMHLDPDQLGGIEFDTGSEDGLRIKLLPPNKEKNANYCSEGLVFKTWASIPATEEQVAFVREYNDHDVMLRVTDDISLPYFRNGEIRLGKDGGFDKSFHPRRYLCPSDIVTLIERAESHLWEETNRFLKLLRWRQGVDSPNEMIENTSLYWKAAAGAEEGNFPLAPLSGGGPSNVIEMHNVRWIHWAEQDKADLQMLWLNPQTTEPLGHELIREAGTLVAGSPRSAILIMTAALETAVKMHIGRVAPDTAWLMEELPAPPIFKILRDYIPTIHQSRGLDMTFWEVLRPVVKRTQKLVEVRNKVAHTGKIPEIADSIHDDLQLVSDLLYILDVLEGQEWAKTQVSDSIRKALEWPDPENGRIIVRMQIG